MPRGRPRKNQIIPTIVEIEPALPKRKFTRIHEGRYTTAVWKYDLDIFDNGPIEVNITHKIIPDEDIDWNKRINEMKYKKAPKGGTRGRPKKKK